MDRFQMELVKLSADINARNTRRAAMANGPGWARNHPRDAGPPETVSGPKD
jgi:hypothetical protein